MSGTVDGPVVVGVVTINLGDADLGDGSDSGGGGLGRLMAIPAGSHVCVDLGDRRWVELSDQVLDRIAGATLVMRAVTVRGTDPDAVRHAMACLARGPRQHANFEAAFTEAAFDVDGGDRW